ncbi:MAG TPA: choice-of-anchor tandem repeat GloVer-containing protein, partial [Bacteroidia bacterium]
MKAFAMCLAVLFSISAYSQQTLWGTVQNGGQHGFGYLYRTDGNGDNLVVVHNFNGVDDGQSPGAVIQAGNGKIYGMTMAGGHGVDTTSAGNITQGGTLYEYDIQTDSFKVLIHFNSTDPQYPPFFHSPSEMRLLEVSPGKLWCVLRIFRYFNGAGQPLNRYITSYDIATNTLTPVTTVPGWNAPGLSDIQYTSIRGELYKAANGYVYGVTEGYAACATTAQTSIGSIIQINPANNAFSWIKPFNCINSVMDGWLPRGNFENVNGKFYSTTYWGGSYTVYPAQGFGVIYEYDPAANTYTKKHDFTNATGNGRFPIGYQVKAANGKLYGASGGGVAQSGSSYDPGIIYEFDPSTDTYTKKINFNPIFTAQDVGRLGSLWLAASNGKLYGTTDLGVFEYDPVNNSTRPAGRFASLNQFGVIPLANSMQEICRKPAYTVSSTTSYTLCTGSYFSHSLQCDNAQSFVWKRNGSIESAQTTGVLEFNSISTANAGNWTCEMTNACGTTTTQIISIAVNPGTGTSSTITTANTSICPNTSITISGNNGGVWNTGQTSPSINISGPGSFQVTNTNACGNTYSNIIIIDTIATPAFPVISFPPN